MIATAPAGAADSPLRNAPFVRFAAAQVISRAGSSMVPVALAFAVLDLELIGRVTSWSTLGQLSAAPLSYLTVGLVSDRLGISAVLLGAGSLNLVAQLSLTAVTSIRDLPGEPAPACAAPRVSADAGAQ